MTPASLTGRAGTASGYSSQPRSMSAAERVSGAGPAFQPEGGGMRAISASAERPFQSYLELGALASAVPCGRLHTRQVLWEWKLDSLAEDAELLVSELLSNAVKASWQSGDPIGLRLLADHRRLLIEVLDRNPAEPQPRPADYESDSGRGFTVIAALSHRWGFARVTSSLKVVWAELLVQDNPARDAHHERSSLPAIAHLQI